ncbi:unnamed protein product [Ilex paraguariensis]|uniref:Uncharacterized protein n=1 Tax=Ilex paraguariensis TaxID=185542 RepID=A0ABC8SIV5_9AQUA
MVGVYSQLAQMTAEDISEGPEWRTVEKERERERRRMRDRQRIQSLSLEEKEKHPARRSRNYQLRRQRAGNAQMGSQHEQASTATRCELSLRSENQALIDVSDMSVECNGLEHVRFSRGQEKPKAPGARCEDGETRVQRSAKLPKRLRLSQIRHLARLLNTPVVKPTDGSEQIGTDVLVKDSASSTTNYLNSAPQYHSKGRSIQ